MRWKVKNNWRKDNNTNRKRRKLLRVLKRSKKEWIKESWRVNKRMKRSAIWLKARKCMKNWNQVSIWDKCPCWKKEKGNYRKYVISIDQSTINNWQVMSKDFCSLRRKSRNWGREKEGWMHNVTMKYHMRVYFTRNWRKSNKKRNLLSLKRLKWKRLRVFLSMSRITSNLKSTQTKENNGKSWWEKRRKRQLRRNNVKRSCWIRQRRKDFSICSNWRVCLGMWYYLSQRWIRRQKQWVPLEPNTKTTLLILNTHLIPGRGY